ncbi:MAG: YcgN family cysteine cluster protein [bacterium]|nr:YcgN family cysteine cluster protein [bacterium]
MKPFWETKTLKQMSPEEWESLCDGCGLCCLQKVVYEDPDEVCYTNVACWLIDQETCLCTDYENRFERQPECTRIKIEHLHIAELMPLTCAYLLVYEGQPLPDWHPLMGGEGPVKAGITLAGKMVPSNLVDPDDLEDYLLPEDEAPNQIIL